MRRPLKYKGLREEFLVSYTFTSGGMPAVIVDDSLFQQLNKDKDPAFSWRNLHLSASM